KKNPETQGIPVVILSSEATEEIFEQHRKLRTRAEEYLRKPIDPDALVERLGGIVTLEASPSEPLDLSEEAMEIPLDDVEEIDSTPPAEPSGEPVDDEIDAFAESAFDALVMGEEGEASDQTTIGGIPPEVQRAIAASAAQASEPAPALEEVAPPLSAPPPKPMTMPPPPPPARKEAPAVDIEELERLRSDLAKARQLAEETGAALDRQKAEVARLEKEASDLRARAAKGGGISSREFLDLREALNSKDKEIL